MGVLAFSDSSLARRAEVPHVIPHMASAGAWSVYCEVVNGILARPPLIPDPGREGKGHLDTSRWKSKSARDLY